jgi:Bacterial TniB protein
MGHFQQPRPSKNNVDSGANPHIGFSVRHRIIEFAAFCEGLRKIEHVHNRGRLAHLSIGLLITGQSGSGKSTLLEYYRDRFPRCERPEQTIVPVLLVETPAAPSVKNLVEAILHGLGDPDINKGSTGEKTRRMFTLLRACEVELLIIDEFQHFCDTPRRSAASQVTDWLKSVLNVAGIPVVVVGLPRASSVIRMNEQLARRFSSGTDLRSFSYDSDANQREFRGILKEIHSRLPVTCTELHEANLARRFFMATNGLIDYIAKIIDEAVQIVGRQESTEIDLETLALAFQESVWNDAPPELNPFSPGTTLRQLNRAGEPFELWDDPVKHKIARASL